MALFFIEMHQGVVAKPELRVCTSQLASCTLITGYNAAGGLGGAYHYPAEARENKEVLSVMESWWTLLKPQQVTLVFAAKDAQLPGYTTPEEDIAFLLRWVTSKGLGAPRTTRTRAARMSISEAGKFVAGEGAHVPGEFETGRIDLDGWLPGYHPQLGGFTLFDSNIGRVKDLTTREVNLVY